MLASIDWTTLISGAALATLGIGLRTIIQAPIKALTEHSLVIRLLSWLSPQQPLAGNWDVTWKVDSRRFQDANTDRVRIHRLFSNVTFTTTAILRDGSSEQCVFVGKLLDKTITGRWFNPADADRGYFGTFQVRLHASLKDARGAWVGWTNDGAIQANDLVLTKAP